jgi:hypothetical protein
MDIVKIWALIIVLMLLTYKVGLDTAEKKYAVHEPEPVLSKCDSLYFANDSLIQRNKELENVLLTYKLGLAQLKMVDKKAHDYVINSGNFKFIENWDQY